MRGAQEENITVTEVPATVGTLYVYAKATDAQGEYVFKLDVVRRDDDHVVQS